MAVRYGDEPDESLTVVDGRKVPMVGSVFEQRDRIVRGFGKVLLKTLSARPSLLREVIPFRTRRDRGDDAA